MIKILFVEPAGEFVLSLKFSNGEKRHFDGQAYLADRRGPLLFALGSSNYFQSAFVDAGALCWPNGFELSGHRVFELCDEFAAH